MIEYKYKKIKGHEQKKFTENGHTMFETDVLRRLQRLAYLEEQIKQGELLPKHDVSKTFNSERQLLNYIRRHIPIAVKPTSKKAKKKIVNPFTSVNAFEEVCKHLAYKLFNAC